MWPKPVGIRNATAAGYAGGVVPGGGKGAASRDRAARPPLPAAGLQRPPAGPPSPGRRSPASPALHGQPRSGPSAADPRPTHPRRSGAAAGRPAPPPARSRAAPAPAPPAAPCRPCGRERSARRRLSSCHRPGGGERGESRAACASPGPPRGRRKPPSPARTARGQKAPQAATPLSDGGSGCRLEPAVPGVTFSRCQPRVSAKELAGAEPGRLGLGRAEVGAPAEVRRPEGRLSSTPHTSLRHLLEGRFLLAYMYKWIPITYKALKNKTKQNHPT